MTKSELRSVYNIRQSQFSSQLDSIKVKINGVSNLRLATAIGIIVSAYFSFTYLSLAFVVLILIVLFAYLIKFHANLFRDRLHLENLVRINIAELAALDGHLDGMDSGKNFIDPTHAYTHDLDIFGDGSLFQYINRATTIRGKARLASLLSDPLIARNHRGQYPVAIQELAPRIEFRQHFQAAGRETGEQDGDMDQLTQWLRHPAIFPYQNRFFAGSLYIVPLLTIGALVATFFTPYGKLILFPMIVTQWLLYAVFAKRINLFHDLISRKKNILQRYSRLLHYVEKEAFQSEKLIALHRNAGDAGKKVAQLASLVNALDARSNAMVAAFVNSFLLYDLQCVYRLEKWKEKNANDLPIWLDTITETEVLTSFATLYYNNPRFCFAHIADELSLRGMAIAHPLLDEAERIGNTLELGPSPSVLIITGANMAGKSTFLRTLGVNVILALNGAPVCATSFTCSEINLRSGMRTADSLKDHQSYFFAELNRLKSIMDELRNDKPLLILLDEILKGTNSNDKQAGSMALVKQLLPHPCLALIATHDLALGDLETAYPDKISNYCFEANIENDQLSFDYKLKRGVAQRMNASFLMQKMGIIPRDRQN